MKPSILIIDDELSIRLLLEYFLEEKYNVVVKENAIDAIFWLNENNVPDVIILDQDMPEISGKEFLKIIAQDSKLSGIPIMMLSGVKKPDTKTECLSLGAYDYMIKPFDPLELEDKLEHIYKKPFQEHF